MPRVMRAFADSMENTLQREAEALAAAMKARVPVKTGRLRDSIYAERVKTSTIAGQKGLLEVRVVAGGTLTTVAARQGHGSYDYSRGVEFGTSDTQAEPFFFNTYRARKGQIRAAVENSIRHSGL